MAERRNPGTGSICLRKDGRWEGRVVIGYNEKGYPKSKNVLAKTKEECEEKLEKLKESLGRAGPRKVCPGMLFGDWVEFWYQNHGKPRMGHSAQVSTEQKIKNYILPELGNIPLNKITQNDLQQFYARLKKDGRQRFRERKGPGLSNAVVRSCHSTCRLALQQAVQNGLIRVNPAVGCKLPPKKAREMQVLNREEMQRLLIQAKEEGYYEVFLLALATGMRRGELIALQWDDLNFDTGELHINKQVYSVNGEQTISTPKTKASVRTIVLPPNVLEVLREYRERSYSRWMFPSPVKDDSPLDPNTCTDRLQTILDHAGCKRVRFHDLRHTFATTALEHGMDVKTLSATIGHVSAATSLDIYTHITDSMQRSAASNIDRGIGKKEPDDEEIQAEAQRSTMTDFKPFKGNMRRAGTGCLTRINDHLWEGRFSPVWPDGKVHCRNVYAETREECEALLPGLIAEMRAEIAEAKERKRLSIELIAEYGSKKKKLVAAYMCMNPEVTNKKKIERETGVNYSTVLRHYDDIREEIKRATAARNPDSAAQ